MKQLIMLALFAVSVLYNALAQYPVITIRQMQYEPPDSLFLADALQATQAGRWTLQASPRIRHGSPYEGDTVTVIALCAIPPKILTFTQAGFTMVLYDTTGNPYPWGGVLVRCSNDTSAHIADGFLNVRTGSVVRMTGVVSEFPATYNSVTQFQPIPGIPIQIIATGWPIPPVPTVAVDSFYVGRFPGGTVRYSSGEQYEGLTVQLVNLTVDSKVNTGRGTYSLVDSSGNQITVYDASRFWTLRQPPDSAWAVNYPALGIGTRVDTIRGHILTVSGSENPRGYMICPVYHGDVVFGRVPLTVTSHRRNPVAVTPDSSARISAIVRKNIGGHGIRSVSVLYSVNNGPFTTLPMALSDTTFKATIPARVADDFVEYFIEAVDSAGTSTILASSAIGAFASDTSKGFFFYYVRNRPLTIRDIQYTPFLNGRTPYLGAMVSIAGIVTVDTGNIGRSPLNIGGTNAWYMQTGTEPWSGIWFADTSSGLLALHNGDSVRITGTVTENFDNTQLASPFAVPPLVIAPGWNVPAPVALPSGTFGPTVGNGTPSAEQWEGMLVRLYDVVVTDTNPTFSDPTEYAVDDGSGPVLIRRDGKARFTNQSLDTVGGKRVLHLHDRITNLAGIVYYSFNRYKLVPRTSADYGPVTSVNDIVHIDGLPDAYTLSQNYPNPFNPSTTIEYSITQKEIVTLRIYNVLGQEVLTLVNGAQAPGKYEVHFDATSLPTGVYFYRLQAGNFVEVRKMIVVK